MASENIEQVILNVMEDNPSIEKEFKGYKPTKEGRDNGQLIHTRKFSFKGGNRGDIPDYTSGWQHLLYYTSDDTLHLYTKRVNKHNCPAEYFDEHGDISSKDIQICGVKFADRMLSSVPRLQLDDLELIHIIFFGVCRGHGKIEPEMFNLIYQTQKEMGEVNEGLHRVYTANVRHDFDMMYEFIRKKKEEEEEGAFVVSSSDEELSEEEQEDFEQPRKKQNVSKSPEDLLIESILTDEEKKEQLYQLYHDIRFHRVHEYVESLVGKQNRAFLFTTINLHGSNDELLKIVEEEDELRSHRNDEQKLKEAIKTPGVSDARKDRAKTYLKFHQAGLKHVRLHDNYKLFEINYVIRGCITIARVNVKYKLDPNISHLFKHLFRQRLKIWGIHEPESHDDFSTGFENIILQTFETSDEAEVVLPITTIQKTLGYESSGGKIKTRKRRQVKTRKRRQIKTRKRRQVKTRKRRQVKTRKRRQVKTRKRKK